MFPTLYKKTSTGAIQFWQIDVIPCVEGGAIEIIFGQLNTDNPQQTWDIVSKGKNLGKKNATTPLQQAHAEAKAKYEKQLKKGYVTSVAAAKAEQIHESIEGGIIPMLAHSYAKHGEKIKYPAYIQPKLDGIRCIAVLKDGKCTLWSRTRKQITSMPHIVAEIESLNIAGDITLDGELYNQELKSNFEHIVHLVRQEEPDPQHADVQYHIYDWTDSEFPFDHRSRWIKNSWRLLTNGRAKYLKLVDTNEIDNENEVMEWFETYRKQGYEGAMVRNAKGKYVNKRSYDLQKVKEFDDGEFDIIGVEEGRGKLQGHAGAFLCRATNGKTFLAKMSGDTNKLRDYFLDHKLWEGKRLTVRYQGLTGAERVPRFPVGIAIRDYE